MIFDEQIARKPDHYPFTQPLIDSMWNGHWTPNEFTFQSDIHDFKTVLTEQEQLVIQNTLSAIGQIEIAVKRFWARLGDNLPHPSLVDLGLVMASVEVIHNKGYEKLLSVLGLDDAFEQNLKLDIIKGRVAYLRKYNELVYKDKRQQYLYSLVLFTLFVENVSLFSQFYIILWFNRFRLVLRDTASQVGYTKNEESIHALAGIQIINTIRAEHPELFDADLTAKIRHEAEEAFKCESKIIDWMLVGGYEGESLSPSILKEYVKGRLNESLEQIGFEPLFQIDQELAAHSRWMEEQVLANVTVDFFHTRSVNYSSTSTSADANEDLF